MDRFYKLLGIAALDVFFTTLALFVLAAAAWQLLRKLAQ